MPPAQATPDTARAPKKAVFVTGANGYIGSAVCRAFVRAGWKVYGLVRRPEAGKALQAEEVTAVVGSISVDLAFLDELLEARNTPVFDVVVSCTEQVPFDTHYGHLLELFEKIADCAHRANVKPLVLMSSGCKDYGTTGVHGSPNLKPHTEESPLDPPAVLKERTYCCLKVFDHPELFDAAVLRPTNVYGYDSSYYGVIFEAMKAGQGRTKVDVPGDFETILHGCHVDDCTEAYVALAEHATRSEVTGECFNISSHRYETLADFARALSDEFGFPGGVGSLLEGQRSYPGLEMVLGFSQWVDSAKIRRLTGWTDRRMLFTENLHAYRLAYEAAADRGDAGVARIKGRVADALAGGMD
ncbi:Uu.00g025780.m01.CDS01 [Anthostomella pinea]|uniref:Uu.00g025780.m01.CDS01 n=1 Tax=Anthostomella pinea TaxID=933095 RepID=A0AAI8YCI0_9PEZI|nr:Uu.00g025780.m01.CDS01 [Anthostomella pinea]